MKITFKDIISCIIIVVVVVLIRTFLFTLIRVNGTSMESTLKEGNIMLLKKFDKSYDRFDIVVVKYQNERIIKRVIGLPKEDVEYKDNKLYINNEEVKDEFGQKLTMNFKDYCGEDEYFVMGDNRLDSLDSRIIGCIDKKDIMGTTDFIFFPFTKFGKVK